MGDWKTRRNRMATCDAMCPLAEIQFRTKNHLINRLEATASSSSDSRSKYVADPSKMVKEYCRSAADTHKYNKPELLRPFPALNMTIDYLLDLYAPFKDRREAVSSSEFASVFSFVSDRFRAVRQDMTMQNMRGKNSVVLIEKMLPFYIETDGLCKVTKCLSFDPKLHEFQLEECYGRWFEEISSSPSIDASPEIFACFFFRQLHRKPTLLHELYLFRYKMSHSTFILIRNVICAFKSNNYRHFFTQFSELEPLLKHSLSDSVASLRQTAIRTISVAFKTPVAKLPSRLVSEWLGFPKNLEHFDTFLRHYNVIPDENGDFLIASIKFVEFTMFDYSTRQYE